MMGMVTLQIALSTIAIVVSCGALAISFLAYRQARNTAASSSRREAIVHVCNGSTLVSRHAGYRAAQRFEHAPA
jgi:hypothetical protein